MSYLDKVRPDYVNGTKSVWIVSPARCVIRIGSEYYSGLTHSDGYYVNFPITEEVAEISVVHSIRVIDPDGRQFSSPGRDVATASADIQEILNRGRMSR